MKYYILVTLHMYYYIFWEHLCQCYICVFQCQLLCRAVWMFRDWPPLAVWQWCQFGVSDHWLGIITWRYHEELQTMWTFDGHHCNLWHSGGNSSTSLHLCRYVCVRHISLQIQSFQHSCKPFKPELWALVLEDLNRHYCPQILYLHQMMQWKLFM